MHSHADTDHLRAGGRCECAHDERPAVVLNQRNRRHAEGTPLEAARRQSVAPENDHAAVGLVHRVLRAHLGGAVDDVSELRVTLKNGGSGSRRDA